jgi:large subunit ribosomal protein L30
VKKVAITLVRSDIGCPEKQRRVVLGLGLKKIRQTVIRPDIPEVRGMIRKIPHLLKVEEVQG